MPETTARDLRVQKTLVAIHSAIKAMILEMDPAAITVKALAERAQIHRKTFYLHYTCIEALFEDLLLGLAEDYYAAIDTLPPDAPFAEVNRVFFTFMARQEPYVEKMVCTPAYQVFTDTLFTATREHNRARHNPYAAYPEDEQHLINTYLCIGSLNLYRQWVADGKRVPLERLIALSGQLFCDGINAIRQK